MSVEITEKDCRVYYQSIVYDVCNLAERHGAVNVHVGTSSSPGGNLLEELQKIITRKPAAEVDNGDGSVTKVCTIPVTMKNEAWETHDVVAFGGNIKANTPYHYVSYPDGGWIDAMQSDWSNCQLLILAPKTPAVDPYWIELREWVDAGGSLPPRAEKLEVFDELRGGNHAGYLITRDHDRGRWVNHHWNTRLLGRLPKNNTKKIITIDLAAFRKWHADRGEV